MKNKSKTPYIVAAVSAVMIIAVFVIAFLPAKGNLKLVFPSLGKADCAVIYEDGACAVIDCGNKGDGKDIADLVRSLGAERIDVLFITHFDKDHIGGAAKLLTSIEVSKIIEPVYDDSKVDISEYAAYRLALESACAAGSELIKQKDDISFTLGSVEFSVWCAAADYEKDRDNNSSLVIKAKAYGREILFAGDIEKQRIDDILGAPYDLKCDLLKMPHHGEYNKSTGKFIRACAPLYAVITSSAEEPEDAGTVSALENAGVITCLTREGALTFTCGKKGITLENN